LASQAGPLERVRHDRVVEERCVLLPDLVLLVDLGILRVEGRVWAQRAAHRARVSLSVSGANQKARAGAQRRERRGSWFPASPRAAAGAGAPSGRRLPMGWRRVARKAWARGWGSRAPSPLSAMAAGSTVGAQHTKRADKRAKLSSEGKQKGQLAFTQVGAMITSISSPEALTGVRMRALAPRPAGRRKRGTWQRPAGARQANGRRGRQARRGPSG
jgi:hypothetical protein